MVAAVLAVALLAAGCSKRSASSTGIADPPRSIGAVANPLDADYQWMYQTSSSGSAGWADRHILLDGFAAGALEMGAAFDPTADTDPTDRGGTSLAAVLAVAPRPDQLTYTWV